MRRMTLPDLFNDLRNLIEWSGRLAQQADPVVTGPGANHAVSPERRKQAADEVRKILKSLKDVNNVGFKYPGEP